MRRWVIHWYKFTALVQFQHLKFELSQLPQILGLNYGNEVKIRRNKMQKYHLWQNTQDGNAASCANKKEIDHSTIQLSTKESKKKKMEVMWDFESIKKFNLIKF